MTDPHLPVHPPRVAVVTVSFGSENVLEGFLASVPCAGEGAVEVLIADNKAEAGTRVSQLALSAGATYLPLSSNVGYGGAINCSVSTLHADIEWILISNPDVVLHEGSIDILLATGDSDPAVGAVGPAILTAEGDVYPSARALPSLRTGVGHALLANLWISNPWTAAYRNDRDAARSQRDAGWLSGACLLVRRSVFDELGGFDEGYFMYFEDVDLGYRIGKAGFRNVYEPTAVVTHTGAHSTSEHSGAMVRAHHASARRFLAKKYSGPLLWPVRTGLGIGLWIRARFVRGRLG